MTDWLSERLTDSENVDKVSIEAFFIGQRKFFYAKKVVILKDNTQKKQYACENVSEALHLR